MKVILNRPLKTVEVYMRKDAEEIKFVIPKGKVNKSSITFDYARKKIVVPFAEMEIFTKEWS